MVQEGADVLMLSKARRLGTVDELFKRRTRRALIQWLVRGPKLISTTAESIFLLIDEHRSHDCNLNCPALCENDNLHRPCPYSINANLYKSTMISRSPAASKIRPPPY